jgi:hypothetical protein
LSLFEDIDSLFEDIDSLYEELNDLPIRFVIKKTNKFKA